MNGRLDIDGRSAGQRPGSTLARMLVVFVAMQVLFSVLLFASYLIPVEPIVDNVRDAGIVFDEQMTWEWMIPGAHSTREDNYTDGLMLGEAVFEGTGDRLQDAFRNSYPRGEDVDEKRYPDYWVIRYVQGDHSFGSVDYWRYWHGYLVLLRPLLVVLNYQGILLLLGLVESLLMLLLVVESHRRYGLIVGAAVATTLFLMTPSAISLTLQLSWLFLVILTSSLVVTLKHRRIGQLHMWGITFLIIGGITSYFDLLTYPTVSLTMPFLLFLLGCYRDGEEVSICEALFVCLSWALGYAGTWSSKWLITSAVLHENCFPLERLVTRSSSEANGSAITYLDVLVKNVSAYNNVVYPLVIAILFLTALLVWRGRTKATVFQCVPVFLMVALIPFAWLFVTKNHAFIHYWMTFRNLAVVPASLVIMGAVSLGLAGNAAGEDEPSGGHLRR